MGIMATLLELHDRTYLNRAIACTGDVACHLDGFIQIFAVYDVIAAQLLLGLGKRPIGGEGFPLAYSHRRRRCRRQQRIATYNLVLKFLAEGHIGRHDGLFLLLRHLATDFFVTVDQQHITHLDSLLTIDWCTPRNFGVLASGIGGGPSATAATESSNEISNIRHSRRTTIMKESQCSVDQRALPVQPLCSMA